MLSKQESAFLQAASDGNFDKVKECIQNGVDRETKAKDRLTALHFASKHGHLNIVRYLVETTCHVNKRAKDNDGETVLRCTCQVDPKMSEGTRMQIARRSHQLDVVRWLIEAGHIDMEAKEYHEWTALHLHIAQYLIWPCHVNKEAKDNFGWTALHYASYKGHLDVVKYLIEKCQVDVEVKDNYYGRTALHRACDNGHFDVVKYLIEKCQVDMEVKDSGGYTALHNASSLGRLDIVQYLIETGHVNQEAKSNYGETASDLARKNSLQHRNVVQYLEKARADDSKTKKGNNAEFEEASTTKNYNFR